MQNLAQLLQQHRKSNTELSYSDYLQKQCDAMNQSVGKLPDYDCPVCKNKGYVYRIREKEIVACECECKPIRDSVRRIRQSGLAGMLETCTFDTFNAKDGWQSAMKRAAQEFLDDTDGNWFYAGGQVGCGKTHICTAIVGEFLKRGLASKYMVWSDEIVSIKANVTDEAVYNRLMRRLKTVPVLYIDDLFKTAEGSNPTPADVKVAFEIFNARYNNRKLITIISSERSINNLIAIDEAVGSRIYQRTKKYCLCIAKDKAKNYRMR